MVFEPHQSFFVVFRKSGPKKGTKGENVAALEAVVRLEGPWEVSFDRKWGGPERVAFEKLEDWTKRPEEGIVHYSGVASYRNSFVLEPSKKRLWLDLGTVHNLAAVSLNGRECGFVWCSPWRLEVTGAAVPGVNTLEVRVANLWVNRLIGDERHPSEEEYGREGNLLRWPAWLHRGTARPSPGRLAFATWKHYTRDSPLLPSGLLGPVRLLAEKR